MGNTSSAKFKGKGHTLGGGAGGAEQPKPVAKTPAKKAAVAATIKAAKPAKQHAPRTPEEQARAQQLLVQKREAAANAALQRTKAWDDRLKQFKTKEQQERAAAASQQTTQLKWNESSLSPPPTMPVDPALARKQREEADKLAKSGFNPYQATMSTSTSARNAIDNLTLPSGTAGASTTTTRADDASQRMAQSRTRLLAAMAGSSVWELAAAIAFAAPFDVPELDEAKDIYAVLVDQQQQQHEDEEEEEEEEEEQDLSAYIQELVDRFATSDDAVELKRLAKSTLLTLLNNLVQSPHEAKFRKIKLANKQIQDRIVKPAGCLAMLEAVGFALSTAATVEDGGEVMCVPDPSTVSPAEVDYARRACLATIAALNALDLG